jgi:RNA polymerase sigma factor (sigma-70 family)
MNAAAILAQEMADKNHSLTGIVKDYSKRLMGFIRRRVSNDADAQDILQDVFYQLVDNTDPIENVAGWLFSVTRNKITDRGRKHTTALIEDIFGDETDEEFLGWVELFFDADNNPEMDYLRAMFWEELQRALDELPTEQRQVFELNELEGISFKDIAEKIGVPVNTLLSRKRYAVLHLRERLQALKNELLNY